MIPLQASKVLVYRQVADDPYMSRRAERLLSSGIAADEVVWDVTDEVLEEVLRETGLAHPPLMGMHNEVRPVVIFNYWRFDEPAWLRAKRRARFPLLFSSGVMKFAGHHGFDWRDSGSRSWRRRTGLVCNPAWQLHSIGGCHFRCAYCSLGWAVNILMNVEEFVAHLPRWLDIDAFARAQKLWQYDNQTDTVCFEPEYGMAQDLVEFFARKDGKWLELYVGKSDNVDFLLDLDHRGKTICCWSVAGRTQSTEIEWRTAPMEARIEAMARCREAGYPVRVRFSPVVPVKNWRQEVAEMIELLFSRVQPDLVTFETLRFMDFNALKRYMDPNLLDDDFLEAMEAAQGAEHAQGCEIPRQWRMHVYRFIIDQLERVSPRTPYALCRAERVVWEALAEDFGRHGQRPDDYVCNCGPWSTPDDPRLAPLEPPVPAR